MNQDSNLSDFIQSLPKTETHLHFEPWEAYYVVFPQAPAANQGVQVEKTNLETVRSIENQNGTLRVRGSAPLDGGSALFAEVKDAAGAAYRGSVKVPELKPIELGGEWKFTPERKSIRAPYAKVQRDLGRNGERSGWQRQEFPDLEWPQAWLSRERFTVRQWSLMGPFPNADYKGFDEVYPPELGFDPKATCQGDGGKPLHWIDFDETSTYYTELAGPLSGNLQNGAQGPGFVRPGGESDAVEQFPPAPGHDPAPPGPGFNQVHRLGVA